MRLLWGVRPICSLEVGGCTGQEQIGRGGSTERKGGPTQSLLSQGERCRTASPGQLWLSRSGPFGLKTRAEGVLVTQEPGTGWTGASQQRRRPPAAAGLPAVGSRARAGVRITWLPAPGRWRVLAEPRIEFEMSNPEPSRLCWSQRPVGRVSPPPHALGLGRGLGRQPQTSPRGHE